MAAHPFQKFREVASNLNRRSRAQHDQNVIHHQPNLASQVHGDIASKRGLHDAMKTKFRGIYCWGQRGKQGVRMLFEPRVSSRRDNLSRIYLEEYESLKQAVLIRDAAHFALGKQGPFNVDPRVYIHGLARPIPQGMSPQQIRKFVEEGAQKVNQPFRKHTKKHLRLRSLWQSLVIDLIHIIYTRTIKAFQKLFHICHVRVEIH